MNNAYIKASRLNTLWRFFVLSKGDYELTYTRALQMGVSKTTAKGYMDNLLARMDKLNQK